MKRLTLLLTGLLFLAPFAVASNDTSSNASTPINQDTVENVASAATGGGLSSWLEAIMPTASTMQNVLQILYLIIGGAAVIGVYYYYLWQSSFKHRVVLRQRLQGNTQVNVEAARLEDTPNGRKIVLSGESSFLDYVRGIDQGTSMPGDESIEQGQDGSYVIHGLRDSQNEITWSKPVVDWEDKEELEHKPASTQMRQEFVNQRKKSEELRDVSWFERHGGMIATGITLAIVTVGLGFFMEKISVPADQLASNAKEITDMQVEIAEALAEANMETRIDVPGNATPPNPGRSPSGGGG